MVLNKIFKEIIKIKDIAYLNELGAEIVEYCPKENSLLGKLYLTGAYHSSKTDEVKLIAEDINFTILLDSSEFYINDIECINFEYQVLEGVGLEFKFEIELNIDIEEELDERELIQTLEQVELESIKEEITNEVDEKLSSKLTLVEDNYPQEQVILRSINDKTNKLKVVYYEEDKELNNIAKTNNISIEHLLKENKTNNFSQYKRVIIKNGK